jgi:hypothetical protein
VQKCLNCGAANTSQFDQLWEAHSHPQVCCYCFDLASKADRELMRKGEFKRVEPVPETWGEVAP